MRISHLIAILSLLAVQGCASSPEITEQQLLDEFRKMFGSSAAPCPEKPECYCANFTTSMPIPLRYDRAQYCPVPDSENLGRAISFDSWDNAGHLVDRGLFVDGEMQGEWTSWHPNGRIAGQTFFKHGVQNGRTTNWHDNGQISLEGQYINGKEDGQWLRYSNDGKIIQRLIWKAGEFVSKSDG